MARAAVLGAHTFGGPTVVTVTGDILKIYVHTGCPEAVFNYAARWGRVDSAKAQDMRAQRGRNAPDVAQRIRVLATPMWVRRPGNLLSGRGRLRPTR